VKSASLPINVGRLQRTQSTIERHAVIVPACAIIGCVSSCRALPTRVRKEDVYNGDSLFPRAILPSFRFPILPSSQDSVEMQHPLSTFLYLFLILSSARSLRLPFQRRAPRGASMSSPRKGSFSFLALSDSQTSATQDLNNVQDVRVRAHHPFSFSTY